MCQLSSFCLFVSWQEMPHIIRYTFSHILISLLWIISVMYAMDSQQYALLIPCLRGRCTAPVKCNLLHWVLVNQSLNGYQCLNLRSWVSQLLTKAILISYHNHNINWRRARSVRSEIISLSPSALKPRSVGKRKANFGDGVSGSGSINMC